MNFKLSGEPLLAIIISFASALSGYFIGIVSFPQLSNEHLSQGLIDLRVLTIITCFVFFLVLLYPALHFKLKRHAKWYWVTGVIALLLFYIITFKVFFPYKSRFVINVYECDTSGNAKYLIGTEYNSDFLKVAPDASRKTAENLILGTACSPHRIWTAKSIERNYNTLISYYIICIFLFTSMIFLLLQAILCYMKIPAIQKIMSTEKGN